jgi:hypothetical protein
MKVAHDVATRDFVPLLVVVRALDHQADFHV